ncbi:MAG: PAS domain S-box protein [Oscillochloris sp.]|nr:PAS domain S-box protein [Oscillochloris sp.]
MLDLLHAIDTGAEALTALIDAAIADSNTVYRTLPPAQRHDLAEKLSVSLREAIDLNAATPLIDLLQSGEIYRYGSTFADTQALFALTRRELMKLVRPHLAHSADLAVVFVDSLGHLLGAVREYEVERAVREAEERNLKQTQELQAAIYRLEQSYLTSPLATLEADTQGVITRWNPAAERIFGWPAAEAIGRNAIELLVPGLAREHVEFVVGALLSGEATNSRNENIRKDGKLITCQWHNAVLRDADGNVTGWLSQTEDITEQLRAEDSLHERTAYLQAIFNAMNDVVMVIDSNGVYLDIAPTKPELIYAPSQDLIGKRMHNAMPAEHADRYLAVIQRVLQYGEPQQFIYELPVQSGIVWFNATITRLSDQSVLWVARDMTDQRQGEEERIALQEQVIEAQRQALRELSTPIIPITDGVVAMPLIGSLDSMRIQQVMETLLEGVGSTRAETAILDITGVPVVDTQVADALLRAARAVKLLGAQVVLTGIRPEVAQTLVGLGLDLSGITTRATLQSGIAFALAASGVKLNT